jgi:hypothetical protein
MSVKKMTLWVLCAGMVFLFLACGEDETVDTVEKHKFVYAVNLENSYYMGSFEDMKKGSQLKLDNAFEMANSHLLITKHKDYFLAVEGMGVGQIIYKYKRDEEGKLYEDARLTLDPNTNPTEIIVASDTKAYVTSYMGTGLLTIINPETMKVTGTIDISEHAVEDNNPDAGVGICRDGKLFLSLNQNITPRTVHENAYVAVIDVITDEVEKVIVDERVCSIGMAGHTNAFQDDEGNIYFYSGPLAAMCGMPEGLLRIKKGETEWDKDFHIALQSLNGAEEGSFAMDLCYAGKGDVYCFIEKPSLIADPANYDYINDRDFQPYKINVNEKKGGMINLPPSNGIAARAIHKSGDLIYFGINSIKGIGFFSWNPETQNGSEVPVVNTMGSPHFLAE